MPFDLNDKALTRRQSRQDVTALAPAKVEAEDKPGHPLDSDEAVDTHARLLDCYVTELDRQEKNRHEMAIDEDFHDNYQWNEDDATALEQRGQRPLVYNVIATTVNWVLGTEKRGRSDYKVLPRRKEDSKPAERKSQLLKYLSDTNRTPYERSDAFAEAVKAGLGWLEDCVEDDDGEPIKSRAETWRNMLHDSAAKRRDVEDARYIFRSKWVDLDIAQAVFPERAGLLQRSVRDSDGWFNSDDFGDEAMDAAERELEETGGASGSGRHLNRHRRERVRIIECWFKRPANVQRLRGGMFGGELFDPRSRGHQAEIEAGEAEIREGQTLRVYCALFTTQGLLWLGPSPYRHNRYPFTPIWGNRRARNGLPYGIIRGLRWIQEDINKRASKALAILTTKRVIVDHDAVDDHDEAAEEVARTDSYIVKNPGKEFRVETDDRQLQGHMEMMTRSISMIQQASGVTDENLGRRTNAHSGIAIERRQSQGAMATTHYFDNLRFACQVQGEKQISLIEQFMDERKVFRITDMRGKPEYIEVNDGLPENDIARSKADYVLSEADWRASMREAAAAELMELLMKLAPVQPQLVAVMLDLLVESMDIGNREEIVRRIREVTGMRDPDAEEPTPEEVARAEAAKQQAELQQATAEANLRKLNAEAAAKEMQANKAQADTVRANVSSLGGPKRGVIDIVADAAMAPAIAPAVDDLMRDMGFVSRTEKEQAIGIGLTPQQHQAVQQAQQEAQAQAPQQAAANELSQPQGAERG